MRYSSSSITTNPPARVLTNTSRFFLDTGNGARLHSSLWSNFRISSSRSLAMVLHAKSNLEWSDCCISVDPLPGCALVGDTAEVGVEAPTGTGRDSPRDQESVGPPLARAGLVGAASRLVHAGQIGLEASRSAGTWSRPQVEHETRSVALRRPATWRARASGSRLRPAESRRFGPFGPSGSLRRALRFRGCSAVLPTLESFADADRRPSLFVFF